MRTGTARAVIWRNDLLRCTSQAVNSGAGGTGILVQERSGETGAWFAAHTFGGVEDEDVRALAVDGQGRFLMAGFSNSWTDSPDAALFRVPAGPLNGNFEYSVSSLVLPEAAFVGHEAPNGDCWDHAPSALRSGTSWEEASLIRWSFHDLQGRQLQRGNTSVVAVPFFFRMGGHGPRDGLWNPAQTGPHPALNASVQSRVGQVNRQPIFALASEGKHTHFVEGGIAQLARALAWHARGPGFESPYLHNNRTVRSPRTVFFWLRSSMDRIRVSGTLDAGSIPAGATLRFPGECLTHRGFFLNWFKKCRLC